MVDNRIREMRNRLSMTQEQAADFSGGPSKAVMSLIENGYVMPTRQILDGFCEAFSCTPCDLYREEDLDIAGTGSSRSHFISFNDTEYAALSEQASRLGFSGPDEMLRFFLQAIRILTICTFGGK